MKVQRNPRNEYDAHSELLTTSRHKQVYKPQPTKTTPHWMLRLLIAVPLIMTAAILTHATAVWFCNGSLF